MGAMSGLGNQKTSKTAINAFSVFFGNKGVKPLRELTSFLLSTRGSIPDN